MASSIRRASSGPPARLSAAGRLAQRGGEDLLAGAVQEARVRPQHVRGAVRSGDALVVAEAERAGGAAALAGGLRGGGLRGREALAPVGRGRAREAGRA